MSSLCTTDYTHNRVSTRVERQAAFHEDGANLKLYNRDIAVLCVCIGTVVAWHDMQRIQLDNEGIEEGLYVCVHVSVHVRVCSQPAQL